MTEFAQFAHLGHAALSATRTKRGRDKKWTAKRILDEAARVAGAANHVLNPRTPTWLVGSRQHVEQREAEWRNQASEAGGMARLRATSPSLACAVFSWPRGREREWQSYRDSVIRFLVAKHGPRRVVGVVEHLDESHQHIHAYLVALDGEPFGAVHPGIAARVRARKLPGNHVRVDYIAAMKEWQDEVWRETGRPHGLTRVGPLRERLSRIETNAKSKSSKAAAEAAEMKRSIERRAATLAEEEGLLRKKATEIINATKHLQRLKETFAATPAGATSEKLAKMEATLAEAVAENKKLEEALKDAQFRNAEHEKLARALGRREREGVVVEVWRPVPSPYA